MGAPSHGTMTIYKERIREVNSVLLNRKKGGDQSAETEIPRAAVEELFADFVTK